jgi:hypothetical protein
MFHHPVALIILTIKGITMTSTSIYTAIDPTYLYIKQHSITGLKYFGKTIKDPYTYNGSGKHWTNHIKKHGKEHIKTLWVSEPYTDTSIVEVALKFSAENDIVNSKKWANLMPENGLDGGSEKGRKHKPHKPCSEETKAKLKGKPSPKKGVKGKPHTDEAKAKMKGRPAPNKGKPHTDEAKAKMHKPRKPHSEETKVKMRKPKPQKQITCPHCGKTGGNNMKRYHFDKCKCYTK